MDKHYCKVTTGPSTTADFIDYIHEACEARTVTGALVISPGCTIFSDDCKIHVGWADTIPIPFLAEKNIEHHWIPKYSPDLNLLEMAFSLTKRQLALPYFQTLIKYSVPLAIMESIELIGHEKMYQFFKRVSGNYMNL